MPKTTIQKHLGHGGALLDGAAGQDNLNAILARLALDNGKVLTAYQPTIATATILSYLADRPTYLRSFRASAAVAGVSGTTTVKAVINGVDVPGVTLDIVNTDTDGIKKAATFEPVELKANDLLQFVVSAAAGTATGLTVSSDLSAVDVAP